MVPAAVVSLAALPLTPSGKLDRKALPTPEPQADSNSYVAPRSPTEAALAGIWAEVLGVERVGVDDDFFTLGGDSILSIQVVSRAARQGVRITPRQIFEAPTVAALARAAASLRGCEAGASAEQGLIAGPVPLTPIQHWFFAQEFSDLHHWNFPLAFESLEPIDPRLLDQTMARLVEQHDALRLRFRRDHDGAWRQTCVAPDLMSCDHVDLRHLTSQDLRGAIEEHAIRVQASLDLERGPLMRVVHFRTADGLADRVLWVLHHLVVDGLSWRVLLEDFATVYSQLHRGEAVTLPPKTTSFKAWAERLAEHAQTQAARAAADFWLALPWERAGSLPLGLPRQKYTEQDLQAVTVELDQDTTRALLQEVPPVYGTQINDVLLAALTRVVGRWTEGKAVLVELEGHGREELFPDLDISRTVGWFTSAFPVLLDPRGTGDWGALLRATKEQLRALPDRGVTFGILRWLSSDEALRERLAALPRADISFNYMGQTGPISALGLRPAADLTGPARSPHAQPPHLLDVTAAIVGDRLQVRWSYPGGALAHPVIRGIADEYAHALDEIIAHCRSSIGGYTPSDFPLARFSQDALDRVLSQVGAQGRGLVEDLYPLTALQEGILFHAVRDSLSDPYVQEGRLNIHGRLDAGAFYRAWQAVVSRYEVLRAAFVWRGLERPVQVIQRGIELPMEQLDWRRMTSQDRESQLVARNTAIRAAAWDVSRAPLMRVALIRVGEQDWELVWHHHHLLLDGWSVARVWADLMDLYPAETLGQTLGLPPAPRFRDYVEWLERQDRTDAEAFWRRMLDGFDEPTPLPAAPLSAAAGAPRLFGEERRSLSRSATERLTAAARAQGLTLTTVLQGAWAVLLSRYTLTNDVLFGNVASGREAAVEGMEELVGMLINTLPLRVRVDESASASAWLRELQAQQTTAREFGHMPLTSIARLSSVEGGRELFQTLFAFENYPHVQPSSRGTDSPNRLEFQLRHVIERTNYPLTVVAVPSDELEIQITFDAERFDTETVKRLAEHYVVLIEGMSAAVGRQLRDIPMLTAGEQRQLQVDWSGDARDYPHNCCIHKLFEEQADRTPDAIAVMALDHQFTYAELNCRANQLAHYLRRRGVGPEIRVGVALSRSPALIVAWLATLKAGGAYVPLDLGYPAERLRFMIDDAEVKIVITQGGQLCQISGLGAEVLDLDGNTERIELEESGTPHGGALAENLALVIFTSGSTGRPKGIAIVHQAVNRLICNTDYLQLGPTDRVAQVSNASFDAATFEVWGALLHGARLVILPTEVLLSPKNLLAEIRRHEISTILLTTALFNQVAAQLPEALRSVGNLLFGGEAADPAAVRQILTKGPPARLLHAYGPAETTTLATCYRVEDVPESAATVPIGRPIANTRVYVVDRHQILAPAGIPGELFIGGPGVARGYLGRPALTAERFVPDPFGQERGARLYRSGDRVRWRADGTLEFLGRFDQQVKLRGYRIEPGEIEGVLRQQPGVQDVVVLACDDRLGQKYLLAYYVPNAREELAIKPGDLRAYLDTRLPSYMMPVAFIRLDALPLTPNGKLDRKALLAPEPAAEPSTYVAPRTHFETSLAMVWSDVLGVERVGVNDDFFLLGGHSLLAMQIAARAGEALAMEVPIHLLFEAPTVAGLAARLEAVPAPAPTPCIPRASRVGRVPLSFAQQRLWFLDQLVPGSLYNIPAAVHLTGQLAVPPLERALAEIVRRHEALRTRFENHEGVPSQVIDPPGAWHLAPIEDLTHLPDEERQAEASRRAGAEASEPFDLAAGPLLRVRLLRLEAEQHVLLLTVHHIVADGWSVGVFLRELAALYEVFRREQPSQLPDLPVQYADYALWQRGRLEGKDLERHITYWRGQLAGAPPWLELPTDRPPPAVQSYRGATARFTLPAGLVGQVKRLALSEDATLFMTLLAAFQALLARWSGQHDISVGVPIANRDRRELQELIGFFVNTLVLRTDLSDDPGFRTLVQRVRQIALDGYAHQELPFEHLVEELQPARDLNRTPMFQVVFTLQNASATLLELPGLVLTSLPLEGDTAKFDLSLNLDETADGLAGEVIYKTDLFDGETVRRLIGHFQAILEAGVADPDRPISHLAWLSCLDRQRVLVDWNATSTLPETVCVHQRFEAQVRRTPDAGAVTFAGETITYDDLDRRAQRLAAHLRELEVGPDVVVAVQLGRSPEMVVALLAVLKAGGAYLPLDPEYPTERLAFMLGDSGARVLITDRESAPANLGVAVGVAIVLLENSESWPAGSSLLPEVSPDNLAYVIYTSGSTGNPKGVMICHRALANHMGWMQSTFSYGPSSVVIQKTPVSFDASVWEFFAPLLAGGRLVIGPPGAHRDTEALARIIISEGVDTLQVVPTLLRALVAERRLTGCGTLRRVFCGGEALSSEVCKAFFSQSSAKLWNLYGPTETTIDATYYDCCLGTPGTVASIGRPVANTRCYVLDARGEPVPVGVPGELYLGGVQVGRGYVCQPALTAERFLPDPFGPVPGARLYRTGDRVRWRGDGTLDFLGRLDHQVKLRGYRIEPGEIEAALRAHPEVREAAVLVREDRPGERRLVGYVVPGAGAGTPDPGMLRRFVGERLPAYMVPAAVVSLAALPLTPSGKLDRKALPTPADGQRLNNDRAEPPAAETTAERVLAHSMAEVLGLARFGVDDDFFTMGGHSLLAVRVLARIKQTFGWAPPLATLYRAPTPRALAQTLTDPANQAGLRLSPLVPMQRGGSGLPVFCIHPVWPEVFCYEELANHLGADRPVYGLRDLRVHAPEITARTIEELAATYVAAIRTVQPEGPYRLAGYSLGGVIAYEMAREFRRCGQEVPVLALLDARGYFPGEPLDHRVPITTALDGALEHLPPDFLDRLRALPAERQVDYALRAAKSARLPELFHTVLRIYGANTNAWQMYRPGCYDGRMLLFMATAQERQAELGPLAYWEPVVKAGIVVHSVPGDHITMLKEPGVTKLAEALAGYL
jgi:amino acid adenylation domain-containing protein/non-ribosomal peptide synthase protein (TIGR01720 family)